MEIPRTEAEELKRYCINASPLLWGVVEGRNKKKRLEKIKELGFLRNTPRAVIQPIAKLTRNC